MNNYLMVADDFTGAGDAGVQMSKRGIEAHIIFDPKHVESGKSYVIDSESRNIPADEAYGKVKHIYESLKDMPFDYYYKKIDSTIRGNIKAELQAAMEVLQPDLVVFNPANPDSHRTVIDGVLYMNDKRVCETEIMRDPLCLVQDDNLISLLEVEMEEPVQFFSITQVRQNKLKLNGSRFITFDVIENADMDKVVRFLLNTGKKILWVGSAGMANALFGIIEKPRPVLALVGSIAETSRKQVVRAVEQGATLIEMNPSALMKGAAIEDVAEQVIKALENGEDTVVVSCREHEDYLESVDTGKKMGMTRQQVAKFTQKKIGELARIVLSRVRIQGAFLTGGDTAISVINHMDAKGARLITDIFPVTALVRLDGGIYPNLQCIMKGGSIGDNATLVKSIEYFHST